MEITEGIMIEVLLLDESELAKILGGNFDRSGGDPMPDEPPPKL